MGCCCYKMTKENCPSNSGFMKQLLVIKAFDFCDFVKGVQNGMLTPYAFEGPQG